MIYIIMFIKIVNKNLKLKTFTEFHILIHI
jgi:hypothetical protein